MTSAQNSGPATQAPPSAAVRFPLDELVRDDARYQYRSAASVTLDNAVHPLLVQSNWAAAVDYEAILPALRSATLMIGSEESLRYYAAICLSISREVAYIDRPGTYRAMFRPTGAVSYAAKAKLGKVWGDLASYVSFKVAEIGPPTQTDTRRDETRRGPQRVFPVEAVGHASVITISTHVYGPLLEARRQHRADPTSSATQDALYTAYFNFVVNLGHEIAHAVEMARWPPSCAAAMPFERQVFSEGGYDWEACVFGGIYNRGGPVPSFLEWPAPARVEAYLKFRIPGIAVTASLATLTSNADSAVMWRIPPCFIRAIFQKEYCRTGPWSMREGLYKLPKLDCFNAKEYAMRAAERGNGAIQEVGYYDAALRAAEMARMEREKAEEARRRQVYSGRTTGGEPLPSEVAAAALMTTSQHADIGTPAPRPCIRGEWGAWCGPRDDRDHEKFATSGVPGGYKLLRDGSVVLAEHADTVAQCMDPSLRS